MKLYNSIILIFISSVFSIFLYVYIENHNEQFKLLEKIKYRSEKNHDPLPTIAHAGGSFNGKYYTNSLEALEWNKNKYEYFELDFSKTSDGIYVCAHGWSEDKRFKALGDNKNEVPTFKDFLQLRQKHIWTACTLEEAINWAIENDKKIVTDFKESNLEGLQQAIKLNNRAKNVLIPQIYSINEYEHVNSMNFDKIILTLYKTDINEYELEKWLLNKKIYAITTWHHRAPYLTKIINDSGFPVYVHTINDKSIATYLSDNYGIQGIYTDTLNNYPF